MENATAVSGIHNPFISSFSGVLVTLIFPRTWTTDTAPNASSPCHKDCGTDFVALYPSTGCSCFDISNIQTPSEAAPVFGFFHTEALSTLLLVK